MQQIMLSKAKRPDTSQERSSLHAIVLAGNRDCTSVAEEPGENTGTGTGTGPGSWEMQLRRLGATDPESAGITGIIVQFKSQFVGYLESNEISLLRAVSLAKNIILNKSAKLHKVKVVFICYNIKERVFVALTIRKLELPAAAIRYKRTREHFITMVLQLIVAIRKHSSLSIKKALDLINEKYSHLLPNPSLIDSIIADDNIPDLMFENQRRFLNSVVLDEDVVWPVPTESFLLHINPQSSLPEKLPSTNE